MVAIALLHDVDDALPTDRVDSFVLGIEEEIVRVTANRQARDSLAVLSVVDEKRRRLPRRNEQSMVGLIEGHGKACLQVTEGPRSDRRSFLSIDDRDLLSAGYVDE